MKSASSHRPFYIVELSGNSRQRGVQHGRLLKTPIERAVEFYRGFFAEHIGLNPEQMRRRAARFIEPTARVSQQLMSEYEGIAEGSGQALEDIFALSGRYEITYEMVQLGECSNVFVGPQLSQERHTLLGQNWEWRPEVLNFRAILKARCDDLPDHIMVTECGQPGKYGFNEYGLGVVETGLCCASAASVGENLFVAVIRGMLAHSNFAAARQVIHQHPPESTMSFLMADDEGNAVNFEAVPNAILEQELKQKQIYWHTNHCLLIDEPCAFEDSVIRGQRWAELISSPSPITRQTVGAWLADTDGGYSSICKAPNPALAKSATWLQTLCSIVMDLNLRTMWVSDGLSSEHAYKRIGFDYEKQQVDRSRFSAETL
ncbi:MAG TPA: C45 family peptidase [Acidobacteriota bacterium]|jgi:isopenicillin-N N-acyltransferase-like protein|nr:C45 family peptidase [Acidobacteriota bacterium]